MACLLSCFLCSLGKKGCFIYDLYDFSYFLLNVQEMNDAYGVSWYCRQATFPSSSETNIRWLSSGKM